MRKMLLTSSIALLGLAAIPVSAMPVAPLSDAPTNITPVAMGCGPGWTRGPYGHCHPMGGAAWRPVLTTAIPTLTPTPTAIAGLAPMAIATATDDGSVRGEGRLS